ncbi:serine/threonine protein kinase [Gimesia maris]|uniref:Serine/threonine-protein kinase PknB n=1 Tax=Gimesia maris TaxID=122 RepID=A0ABX5YMG0_9PLAN|nr:serine/threonine-protein kinase [Gimesia maris]EDL59747.1 serine/threonine protein kinase [Gimesia maris DSM 8797]QEG16755.1 Serine/threonine-protein kinase PknB [Gimesia maris]QGQ30088.1 serine/threonine protein kinase [Gimesia maris]
MFEENQLLSGDLEMIIASCMRRIDLGEIIDQQQLLLDHPHLKTDLAAYFADVALIEKLAGPTASDLLPSSDRKLNHTQATNDEPDATLDPEQSTSQQSDRNLVLNGQFGRYQIEALLGEGAMGAVYLAHDTELDRQVAVKVPKIDDPDSEAALLERFYREARAAATLRHRGICPVYDVGSQDGFSYIAMAYISGMPLSRFLSSGKIKSMRNIAVVIRKLALALESAHQKGVIHRDLKPANIIMDEDNEPVIMDFGLARQLDKDDAARLTTAGMIMGSPAYMSPEQVSGDINSVGTQSDIYSLGVILYELLTGRVPFEGPVVMLIGQIIAVDPVLPSKYEQRIDPELEAICLKMMAKKKEERYQSMREVVDALTAYLKNPRKLSTPCPQKANNPSGKAAVPVGNEGFPALRKPVKKQKSERSSGNHQRRFNWFDFFNGDSARKKTIFAAALPAFLLLGAITFLFRTGDRTVKVTIDDPTAGVTIDGKDKVKFDGNMGQVDLEIGQHEVTVTRDGAVIKGWDQFKFEVENNGKQTLAIEVLDRGEQPPKVSAAPRKTRAAIDQPDPVLSELLAIMKQKPVHVQEFDFNRAPLRTGSYFTAIRDGRMLIEADPGFTDGAWPWADHTGSGLIQVDVRTIEGAGWLVNLHNDLTDLGFLIELKHGKMSLRRSLFGAKTNSLMPAYHLLSEHAPTHGLNQFDQLLVLIEGRKVTVFLNGKQCGDPVILDFDIGKYRVCAGALNNSNDHVTKVEYERILKFPLIDDAPLVAGEWQDLISDLDLKRDVISGNWEKTGNTLNLNSGGYENILRLSARPQGSYEVEFAFTRHILLTDSKAIALALPVGNRSVDSVFFGWGTRKLSGLATIGGLDPSHSSSPCSTSAFIIEEGKRHEIRLQVLVKGTLATISAFADGNPLYSWQGDVSQLSSGFQTITKDPVDTLLLVSHGNGKTTYHKLRWRKIDE